MATTTTNQGIRIPQSTDDPDVVGDLGNAVLDIEKRLVMVFASSSVRSTKLPSPAEGMLCWLQDVNVFQYHNGTAWVDLLPAVPAFSSGAAVPLNSSGKDGDVFFKV